MGRVAGEARDPPILDRGHDPAGIGAITVAGRETAFPGGRIPVSNVVHACLKSNGEGGILSGLFSAVSDFLRFLTQCPCPSTTCDRWLVLERSGPIWQSRQVARTPRGGEGQLLGEENRAAVILRQLRDGPIRVIPLMRIDGKRVVPRLEFTINLVAALLPAVAEPLRQPAGDEAATEPVAMLKRTLLVSAFDEPQLVKHAPDRGAAARGQDLQGDCQGARHGELRRHHAVDGRREASRAVPPIDGKARPPAAASTGFRRANARAAAGAAERHDIRDSGTQPMALASVARFRGQKWLAAFGRPRRWLLDHARTFPRCVAG